MLNLEDAFEARYYMAESHRLRKESERLLAQSDKMLQMSMEAWKRVKEQGT